MVFNLKTTQIDKESQLVVNSVLLNSLRELILSSTDENITLIAQDILDSSNNSSDLLAAKLMLSGGELIKLSYSYIDDVLERIRYALDSISKLKPFDSKAYSELKARYTMLSRSRDGDPKVINDEIQQSLGTLYRLKNKTQLESTEIEDTSRMRRFYNYEQSGIKIDKVPSNDQSQPDWVVLFDLKFFGADAKNPSRAANFIKEKMGDWIEVRPKGNDPKHQDYDTYIRGTEESWSRFCRYAPMIFSNVSSLPNAKALQLKKETDYNPVYQGETSESPYPISVTVINTGGKQDWWEVGNKPYKEAIRIQFAQQDVHFYNVANLLSELGFDNFKQYNSRRIIDIYDLNTKKLESLSSKLQQVPYKYDVKPLNAVISQLTGQTVADIRKKKSLVTKAKPLSDKVIQARLNENDYATPMDRHTFGDTVKNMYPGAFKVGQKQIQAQTDGMYFILSHGSSILADEPGAGKTAQAIVGSDFATHLQDQQGGPKKRILVFTPLPLIEEHWMPGNSKPELYCGHKPESILHIRSLADFNKAKPETRWVVVPYTTMSSAKDRMLIAKKILDDSKNGVYGSTILDEIQTVKNLDGKQGAALQMAISAGGIKHRVGMTGTPADNDPTNFYTQLRITRHPLLYDTEGNLQQNEKGFADQFLGGESVNDSNIIKLKKEGYKYVVEGAVDRLVHWAMNVNRENIVKIFTSTFLRRTKNDMREDMPSKDRSNEKVIGNENHKWNNRFNELKDTTENPWQPFEEEMAIAKIPYTVKSSITHLTNDPNAKLFVVTKYPEIAERIAAEINNGMKSDGIAAAVHGQSDDMKMEVPRAFKNKAGASLPGKKDILRCAVYTMGVGAVGLNFGIANKAIFNDIAWNPSTNLQAEDRVHRIDGKHDVSIEYIYFSGTYDEEMFKRVRRKEAINLQFNSVLRKASNSKNPDESFAIANDFILSLVDSILFGIHMTPEESRYAEQKKQQLRDYLDSRSLKMYQPTTNVASGWYNRLLSKVSVTAN